MRTDENIVLLGDQYDHLRRGQYAPLLEAYLNPTVFLNRKTPVCDTPLYPFYTNASQMEALENSLCHRISIIQGPPGTGKTETILSIVLNLVFNGKTVMVVAGSNSAAENVAEKLQQEQMGFLVAKLGRKSNKEAFINEQHTDNLCPSGWAGRSSDEPAMNSKIHQLSTALKDLFILDRQLHKAIEEGDQKTVLNLRKRLVKESYNEKKEELKATSLSLIRQQLFKRFGGDYRRQVYSLEDLGENSVVYESFKKDYPVVISTAYSATKSVAGQALFDYIVMDEASQIAERIAICFITDVLKDYRGLIVRFRYPLHKLIPDTSGLDDEEEVRFVHNKDSHVDFMIFERKTMKPFLAIEIDGASYHIEGSFQGQRDKLKDGILEKYGIPMKRFRTKESINEVNILESLLLQIFHMPTHLLMTGIEGTVRD